MSHHTRCLGMLHSPCGTSCIRCRRRSSASRRSHAGCGCPACHSTTVSDLGLHPGYNTLHKTAGNGCTGTNCHPVTALSIHGRTGRVNSCHKNPVASLTLSCNSGTCHSGVHGGSDINAHMALHTSVYTNNETCAQCHSSDWHDDGDPIFYATITAGCSCTNFPSSSGPLGCHSGLPARPARRAMTTTTTPTRTAGTVTGR